MIETQPFPAELPIGEKAPIKIGSLPATVERVKTVPEGLPDADPQDLGGAFGESLRMWGATRVYLPNLREAFPSYVQILWNGQPAYYMLARP